MPLNTHGAGDWAIWHCGKAQCLHLSAWSPKPKKQNKEQKNTNSKKMISAFTISHTDLYTGKHGFKEHGGGKSSRAWPL